MAIVHISSREDAREAIEAGADGLAHLFADSPSVPVLPNSYTVTTFVITTLTATQSSRGTPSGASLLTDNRLAEFLNPDVRTGLKAPMPFVCSGKLENALVAVMQLHKASVPVRAATDAPAPGSWNGVSLHQELQLLVRAGFSPADGLAAATSVPTAAFHLNDRGRIAPGLRADLLLVRGDPTQEITATRNIIAVWKCGVSEHRPRLNR